jgi:UDP-2,3-diacylglucosamine pyrophosphatase LpxH
MDFSMSTSLAGAEGRVRSIFVSDVHLGYRHARAEAFLDFLQRHEPEHVYLVGDFIDGWRLRRSWHWQADYNRIFQHLLRWSLDGVIIRYTPGNHDGFLRHFLHHFGCIEVADEFIHRGADERRYLVMHGDQFDDHHLRSPWLSAIGGKAYDLLVWADHQLNRLRERLGWPRRAYSAEVKSRIKRAVRFVSDFEQRLAMHARQRRCDGVICGHVHTPTIAQHDGIVYCNTGDWVENCTALVEDLDGRMRVVRYAQAEEVVTLSPAPASAHASPEPAAGVPV